MKRLAKIIASSAVGLGLTGTVISSNIVTTEIEQKEEKINYSSIVEYDPNIRDGETSVKQLGKDGYKSVTYEVSYKNGKEVDRKKKSEHVIAKAQNEIITKGTKKYYTCSNGVEYDSLAEKEECEKRIKWEATKEQSLSECKADNSKFNCWFDEYPGTMLHWDYYTYTPQTYYDTPSYNNGARSGAVCRDGTTSRATGRGACSHHGGVSYWLY